MATEKIAVEKAEKTEVKNPTSAVHFTLQGKGGVGKSLVSALLAQYFGSVGADVKCIDTDPVNQTLMNYKALNAQHVNLMNGSKIDERNFDSLMERLLSEDGIFIVDNGASSFVPLSNYLIENNAIGMLQEAGRDVFNQVVREGNEARSAIVNDKNPVFRQKTFHQRVEISFVDFRAVHQVDVPCIQCLVIHQGLIDWVGVDALHVSANASKVLGQKRRDK